MVSGNETRNLLAANQGGDDAGTHNKGQDKAVHAVPIRSSSLDGGPGIVVVEESKGKELGDKGVLNGEQKSRPGNGGSNDTGSVAPVAEAAAVASPLKTPVDSSKEGKDLLNESTLLHAQSVFTHHSAVSDLDGLEHVQHELSALTVKHEAVPTSRIGVVDLESQVHSLHRRSEVWDHTSHAEVKSVPGDGVETEGFLDDFL